MLKLYDVVKLKNSRPEISVTEDNTGTIIDIVENGKAYSVEFFDENDQTIEESIYEYFDESDLILVEPYSKVTPVNFELASGK